MTHPYLLQELAKSRQQELRNLGGASARSRSHSRPRHAGHLFARRGAARTALQLAWRR